MRKQIFVLCLVGFFFSCSKNSDNKKDLNTYVTVVNKTPNDLENILIAYLDIHTGKTILLKEIGNANANSSSATVEISNEKVIKEVSVFFQQSGKSYFIFPPFTLLRHTKNSFSTTDDMVFQSIETDNPNYPQ